MSDVKFSTYMHYGTAAERALFAPSPPAAGQPVYFWYETDTDNYYFYTGAWKGPFSAVAMISQEFHPFMLIGA